MNTERETYRIKKCPHCGRELPEELHFCLYCMHDMEEADKDLFYIHNGKRKHIAVLAGIIMTLVIGSLIIGGVVALKSTGSCDVLVSDSELKESSQIAEAILGQKGEDSVTDTEKKEADGDDATTDIENTGGGKTPSSDDGTEDNKTPKDDETKPFEPDTEKPSEPDTEKPSEPDTEKPSEPDTETPGEDTGQGDSLYAPIELDWNAVVESAKRRVEAKVPITIIWAASEQEFLDSEANIEYLNTMYWGIPDQGWIRTDGYDVPGANDTYEDWFNFFAADIALSSKPYDVVSEWDETLGEEVYKTGYEWNPYVCFLEFQGLKEINTLDCKYAAVIRIGK